MYYFYPTGRKAFYFREDPPADFFGDLTSLRCVSSPERLPLYIEEICYGCGS